MKQIDHFYEEYFIYNVLASLSSSDGTVFTDYGVNIDSDADFKILSSTYISEDARILVKLQDDSQGRYLTKNAVDLQAISGRPLALFTPNSFLPFTWSRPYIIMAGTNLKVQLSDYSGKANTTYLAYHGSKIRPGYAPWDYKKYRYRAAVPFVYSIRTTISASASSIQTLEIDRDAHFLVKKIIGYRTGGCTLTINEGARGRDWTNTSVHLDNFIGNGQFPNSLPAYRFIRKGSSVTFSLQDISGNSNIVEIDLEGVKLYD